MRGGENVASREHRNHWRDKRQRKRHGDPEFDRKAAALRILLRFADLLFGYFVARDTGLVTGARDRSDERRRVGLRGIESDARGLGRKVDRCCRPGDPIQRLFDSRGARRARHSLEREVDPYVASSVGNRRLRRGHGGIHAGTIYPAGVWRKNTPIALSRTTATSEYGQSACPCTSPNRR